MTVGHPGIGLPFGGSGVAAGRGSGFGAQIRAKDDAQEGVYFEVDGADPTWNLVTQESSDGAAEIPPVPAKLRVLGATQNAYVDLTLPGDLQGAVGADGNAVILERTDALPAAVNARGVATSAPLTVTRTAFGDSGYWFNIEARTLGQQSAPDAYFVVDGPGGVVIVGLSSSQVSDWSRVSVSYSFGSQIGVRLQPHGSARYDWLLTITYGFANNFLPVSSLTANLTSGATTISLVAKAFSPSGTTALTSLQDVMGTVRVQLTEVPLLTGSNSWHDMGRAKSCLLIVTSGLTATQAIAAVPSDFGFTVAVASGSQGTTTVLPLPQAQEFEGGSSQRAAEALAVNLNYGGRGLTRVIVKANWSDSPGEASDRHSLASLKTAWDAVTYTDMDGNANQAVPAAAVVGSGVLGTKAQQPATFGTGADSNANTPNRRGKNLVPEVPGEEPSAVISDTSLTVRYRNSGHTTHSLEDLFDVLENHQDIAAWLRYGTPAAGEPEDPGFTRGFHHLSDDSGGGGGGGGQVIPKASSTDAEKVVYNNGDQTGLDDTGYMTVEKWSRAFK
ncbi:MAG: hypothetical protein OXG44_12035, partial [Gammaproteobacteria bacterium]|nr:hypothetical protein [Gammaproteobacteria bacterium]